MSDELRDRAPRSSPLGETLSPALTLLAIFGVHSVTDRIFNDCSLIWGWNPAGCEPARIAKYLGAAVIRGHEGAGIVALSGRLIWTLVAALNLLGCVAAVGVAFHILRACSERYANPSRRALGFLLVFLAISVLFGWRMAPWLVENSPPLLDALRVALPPSAGHVINIVQWIIGASYGAAVLTALTSCFILRPTPAPTRAEPEEGLTAVMRRDRERTAERERARGEARELAERMRLLRTLLYFGTAFMVIVALRFATELRWAADLLRMRASPGPVEIVSALKPIEDYFSVATTVVAITNSLTLIAIYVPAALVLRRRAHRLAAEATGEGPTPAREKWLQERGLAFPLAEQLPRVAALLAPLLAGPIGELIGKVTK